MKMKKARQNVKLHEANSTFTAKKKRQQIKKQILFFFNFLFFSLFELVVYLMDPQLMDETLQTPADVVSGTFL